MRKLDFCFLLVTALAGCKNSASDTKSHSDAEDCSPAKDNEFVCWSKVSDDVPNKADLRLIAVPSDGIEAFMPIGTAADGLPESIQGMWWMDGNPAPDYLISFHTMSWDGANKRGVLRTWGPVAFSWHADRGGRHRLSIGDHLQLDLPRAIQ